jgi:hypothetical protein
MGLFCSKPKESYEYCEFCKKYINNNDINHPHIHNHLNDFIHCDKCNIKTYKYFVHCDLCNKCHTFDNNICNKCNKCHFDNKFNYSFKNNYYCKKCNTCFGVGEYIIHTKTICQT